MNLALSLRFYLSSPGGGSLATTLQAAEVKAISVAECQMYWSNTGETHICVWEEGSKGACNVSINFEFDINLHKYYIVFTVSLKWAFI